MRVLHVNLARGFRGGERQTQLLIEALSGLGVDQLLAARYDSPLLARLASVPGLKFYPMTKPYWRHIPRLRARRSDLVHAHEARAAQWALLNYWHNRTPYVMTRRIDRMPRNFSFTRAVYRNAAAVAGLSAAIRASVQQFSPGKEVTIIPSMFASLPVDPKRVAELRARYRDRFIVGHIGALVDPHKGQSVLIAAAKLLQERYPEFVFLLVGDGEDKVYLQRLAASNPNIMFIGFVEDVGNWIAAFDMFVFPSLEEGLGSTLLDVMQHRKPIVASAVGGILDVVSDGHSGLLVPPGDAQLLAAAIERMHQDVSLREKCVAGGIEQLERYSPRRIAGCYHSLYQSVLNSAV
ncbi:MAG TPA: glycosyltransferase family 4 protein [Gammaproteobacteria bacterium]|nr:glycosyltransferase family 4 protein [Gammaproteobacteria bacterium]